MTHDELPVIGLIPAAGISARLSPLPCSKELLPVGFMPSPSGPKPKPVCLYLLERMRLAGIPRAFLVLRPGKWDIPAYLGHGEQLGIDLGYLIMRLPHGSPYTLDQAYPFVRGCLVAVGFPDIIFEPQDAYAQLLDRLRATGADVVLGLFPTDAPHTTDMVETDAAGRVLRIHVKPAQSSLRFCWMLCVWGPRFTEHLHAQLAELERLRADPDPALRPQRELFVGDVVQAAIDRGMLVQSVAFPEGSAIDVGTPGSLVRAVRRYAAEAELP
jgi:glucose-1-phosphate thymidylyltransferase